MKEIKFTPGPWYAVEYAGYWSIQSVEGYSESDQLNIEKDPNAEANAKLMASAPDLLDALQKLKAWVGKLEDWKGEDPPCDLVDASIKKATE